MSELDNDGLIERLILDGHVEFAGIDADTGEMMYSFTEKLMKDHPEMYEDAMEHFYSQITSLWTLGFLDIEMDTKNPMVRITKKALDESKVKKLPEELRASLRYIVSLLSID
jgi:hypothetical protein